MAPDTLACFGHESAQHRPIELFGRSPSPLAVRLELLGRSPASRDRIRLVQEVRLFGTPFDGSGSTGFAFDTGQPGGAGSACPLVGFTYGLDVSTLYHWRVRTLHASPFFPRSPWFWHHGNASSEANVRTAILSGVEEPRGASRAASGFVNRAGLSVRSASPGRAKARLLAPVRPRSARDSP